ncbi:DUF4097 family beta strand repeat-containing protein [Tenacibaculum agarivorans]|uniref:DUF4097 family beta strand repeat-containing protein n=1 Tax=Tenacibaculum agarivorans TaxID=1908389 RepID=UPI00094B7C71|nr:DUF4097 family beta strand repeat-containing protein [Tenacibaculum agarivorans]
MKKIFFFIGLLLSYANLTGQKKVVDSHTAVGIQKVNVHVKFAKSITIKNWNKNEIEVIATVNLNKNKDNDYFSLQSSESDNIYFVKSDYGDFFEKYKQSIDKTNENSTYDSMDDCKRDNKIHVDYIIYVPKKMDLSVKSISGDVDELSYDGNLTLDLISGSITVKKHSEDMHLKTISGDIDVLVSDAEFKAETLTGTVYSNLDIDFDKGKRHYGGSTIKGKIKNGKASLYLKTISGNIFLRKI